MTSPKFMAAARSSHAADEAEAMIAEASIVFQRNGYWQAGLQAIDRIADAYDLILTKSLRKEIAQEAQRQVKKIGEVMVWAR